MYLRSEIQAAWADKDVIETAFALEGEVFRDMPGRRTLKVRIGNRDYFVKLHFGVGWGEVVKNWLQFKRPVIGARNEYDACRQLAELGITAPLPAAFAQTTGSIANQRSFVLCDELAGYTTLEDLALAWRENPPQPELRHRLLYAVADFAKVFHGHGFIHRDFYICHLLADNRALARGEVKLAVLDLHRARRFSVIPNRWLKRDLAALLFSTMDIPLTESECLRFVARYTGRPLAQELRKRDRFWSAVIKRARRLHTKDLQRRAVNL